MAARQFRIRRPLSFSQVVRLEDRPFGVLAGVGALGPQVFDGQREQLGAPFPQVDLFGRFGARGLRVQFRKLHSSAAFPAVLRLVPVGGEALHGQPEIGAEPGLRRVEALEEIALQGRGEEALREVLGGFVVLVKL